MSEISNTGVALANSDLTGNLTAVTSCVTKQDIKLWTDQGFVQELNAQIDSLTKQIEEMKMRTASNLQAHNEREIEIEEVRKSQERMRHSANLARQSVVLFGQQIEHYQREVDEWRQKYKETLDEHNEKFEIIKRALTEDIPLYRELEKLKIEEKKLAVNFKYTAALVKQAKEIRKQKNDIRERMFYAEIVDFARACQNYNENKRMAVQARKLEEELNNLQTRFKELQKIKAEKEAEESMASCLRLFKQNDFEELPTVSSKADKSFSSTNIPFGNDFSQSAISQTFKMPVVPPKHKTQEADFGIPRKKAKRSDSKIKILDVQTVPPQREPNKVAFQLTRKSSENTVKSSAAQSETTKTNEREFAVQTSNKGLMQMKSSDASAQFELVQSVNKGSTEISNSRNVNKAFAPQNTNVFPGFELPAPSVNKNAIAQPENKNNSEKSDAGIVVVTDVRSQTLNLSFSENVTSAQTHFENTDFNQDFTFGNVTNNNDGNIFNVTNDFSGVPLSPPYGEEFVISPTMVTTTSNEDAPSFFNPTTSDNLFKLF